MSSPDINNPEELWKFRLKDHVGEAAMYEQLAEECMELGQASLKMAHFLRGEVPVSKTKEEIKNDITEEYTDVQICAQELELYMSGKVYIKKKARAISRLNLPVS